MTSFGTTSSGGVQAAGAGTVVYFDGSCPLCRREIGFYKRRIPAGAVQFEDVSAWPTDAGVDGLPRSRAMARFHVRQEDGRLVSGGRAFAVLWKLTPGLGALGRLGAHPAVGTILDWGYGAFLPLRPVLQRLAGGPSCAAVNTADTRAPRPAWLIADLRSDHAGETGAVQIYRGILAVSRSPEVAEFAARHLRTEQAHLAAMERVVPPGERSRLLPVWRIAGWLTGAVPALCGPRAVYWTVDAVETFVDQHYAEQIEALAAGTGHDALKGELQACHADELAHRDEARLRVRGNPGPVARTWRWLVGAGSRAGVAIARRW